MLAGTSYLPAHPKVPATIPTLLPTGPKPFKYTMMSPKIVDANLKTWIKLLNEKFG